MNLRIIGKYLTYLVWAAGVFMLPAALVGLVYGEAKPTAALVGSALVCGAVGLALHLLCRRDNSAIYVREGFVVAGGGWVLISLLGALPFFLSGEIPHYVDAVFETVSGFTTTGSSILTDVEAMSHCLLFWRSFTHWLGGIGVLVFLLAVVPSGAGGNALQLLRAESPGPQVGKMLPKTRESVRILLAIYFGLSMVNLALLLLGGMPVFDAFCTMFGTAGTGGFGIKADSMASYSPYLQNVTTVFMFLFGANFSLYFLVLRKEWKAALKDEELRLYFGIFLVSTLAIAASLFFSGGGLKYSLHHSAFTVSTIMSTTGFATVDFDLWPQLCRSIITVLMIFGAMAGSTAGGFKISRLLILFKACRANIHRLLHPRSVKSIQVNGKKLDEVVVRNVYLYFSFYCGIILLSFILISIDNRSLETNLTATLTCFNNVGPGLGGVGPTQSFAEYSVFSKIILTVDMLLGRLEIFPLLLLAFPGTWKLKS